MNKANNIINKFLLAGDKVMPELRLVDPIITRLLNTGNLYLQK